MRTLGEVKDGVPVRAALTATTDGVSLAGFSNAGTSWELVKHGGRVYLRGWMAAMSDAAMRTTTVQVYDTATSTIDGVTPQKVTLPLDRLQVIPAQSTDEMIQARNIVTDGHFKESW